MGKVIQTIEELDAVLHWRGKHAQAIRERDALQQRLTAADERVDVLETGIKWESDRNALLLTSLTEAEDMLSVSSLEAGQRIEVLEGLLVRTNELLYAIQGDPGAVPSSAIDALRGEVFTALKPADGQALTTCSWQYGAFSWHTGCGQEWMLNDGTPEQNGMHFCHSCGKALVVDEDQPESERES